MFLALLAFFMDPSWVTAIGSVVSVIMAGLALGFSHSANKKSDTVENLDQRMELALARSKDRLLDDLSERFVSKEVHNLKIEAIEKESASQDHRITRNIDQTNLLLAAALQAGFPVRPVVEQGIPR